MVRSTKHCLRKVVGRAKFSSDELLTPLVKIEAVINSRPLSYVSSTDCEEPLTPSHLIVGRRLLNLPDQLGCISDPSDEDFDVDANQLTKRMKHLAGVLNHFWRRWRSEYLCELRDSHAHSSKKTVKPRSSVSREDVVIVHDDVLPRGLWKRGRIQEILVGRDGVPRAALVKVASRDRQHTLLKRPLQLLYPLEVPQLQTVDPAEGQSATFESETSESAPVECDSVEAPQRRPMRAAARRANERVRGCIKELQN